MGRGSVRKIVRVGVVAAIVTTGVVWESSGASAAAFINEPPTRLYMAPAGTTLFASLIGVPVGTLEFGPGPDDIISGDTPDITVDVDPGVLGCDTMTDQPLGEVDYDLDDCPRLQLDVVHGRMKLQNATLLYRDHTTDPDGPGGIAIGDDNLNDPVWRLPGGAIISQIGGGGDADDPNDPAGHVLYHLSGLEGQINAALDGMSYIPDSGYRYVGNNGERVHMVLVSGDDGVSNANHDVEIRVLGMNEAATIDGPANKAAEPEVELLIPPVAPGVIWPYTGSEWTVTDPDNDEIVDTDDDPLPDGEGDKMLLVGYLDCGVPTVVDETGFHLRGGAFQTTDQDIERLLSDFYDLTNAPPEMQAAVDLLLDALNAIEPGLTTLTLATSSPTTYTNLFAGIADIDEVAYSLSQVSFLSNTPDDTCTLYTIVSDLGNNGLPLQYLGDPPTGFEVPFLGIPPIDIEETAIAVGALDEITVDFDPASQFVLEGTTATATILIDPPTHPAFDLRWSAVAGTATAGTDFQGITDATINVPANATSVQINTNAFNDDIPEGPENFLFTLTLPTEPPGSPGGFTRPAGYEITSAQSTQLVTIIDDDNSPAQIDSFPDASVTEGDAGTTDMTFTIGLNQAAVGTESVQVTATPGTATNPDDYGDPVPTMVTFPLGATSATVTVPVVGDLIDEGDHSFTLTLSNPNPVGVTIAPGATSATGTILDDDQTRAASIADASVIEGDAGTTDLVFSITLDQPAKGTESLDVTTTNGSATAPSDFDALAGTPVVFAAGQVTAQVTVTVNADTEVELDETFTISLGSAVNVNIGIGTATGTIINDDGVIGVSVNDVTVTEGDVGTTDATFTITLAEPALGGESIRITTSDGTATVADDDYVADTDDITFALGETTATFTVLVNGDTDVEADETFTVGLSLPVGLVVTDGTGIGTILNDDDDPGDVTAPSVTVNQAVGQSDPTSVSPIVFTVVFSEPVTGFTSADVVLSGTAGATTATISGSGPMYTVTVGGMTGPGTVIASIPAGAALDGALNPSSASTSTDNTVTYEPDEGDVTAPSVTVNQAVGQSDPTSVSPIVFTVVFSEPVTGFATGDVTLAGSAGATTAVVTDSGDATTFSVAVSGMTQDGTVIASVGAGVAADAATNANLASTSTDNTVTFNFDEGDVTAPSVTVNQAVGQSDPTSVSPIVFTVVFSEPVTGFTSADVVLSGSAGATTATISGSGPTYTVAVSGMTGPGTVTVSIPPAAAVDAALNPSTASTSTDNTVTYEPDLDAPLAIDVPDDIVAGNDPGEAGAVVEFAPATASGGTPPLTVSCDRTSGQFFALGTTTITCTAADGDEATVTATFTITVLDTEPPVIADPPDLVRGATSAAGTTVTFATPAATDNAGPPTVTCAPASGGVFVVGATTVTCTAIDAAGNSANASFTVTVTAPGSGALPITGSVSSAAVLLALMLVGAGLATRRIGRRPGIGVG